MKYSFHDAAEEEFFSAIEYYEDCQLELGLRFSEEIYATIKRVCDYPYAWTPIDLNTKRCLTNKFPFVVLYRIENDHILIMAIMNLHRKPGYWKDRKTGRKKPIAIFRNDCYHAFKTKYFA